MATTAPQTRYRPLSRRRYPNWCTMFTSFRYQNRKSKLCDEHTPRHGFAAALSVLRSHGNMPWPITSSETSHVLGRFTASVVCVPVGPSRHVAPPAKCPLPPRGPSRQVAPPATWPLPPPIATTTYCNCRLLLLLLLLLVVVAAVA